MRSLLALSLMIGALAAPARAQDNGAGAPSPPPEAVAPEAVAPQAPEAAAPQAPAPGAGVDTLPAVTTEPDAVAVDAELDLEAAGSELEDSAPPPTEEHWYGWQTLTTDGASLLLLIIAGASSDALDGAGAIGSLSLGTYLLGGPVVHFAHENVGRGFGSLALRGGLPIVFGVVGVQLENCQEGEWFCGLGGAVLGGLLGIVTAITVDASLLSYESVPVKTTRLPNIGVVVGRQHGLIVTGGTF